MKFSIKDFFSKWVHLRIWSDLLKKSLMENSFLSSMSYYQFNCQFLKKQFLKNNVLKTKHPIALLKDWKNEISNGSKLFDTFG